MVSLQTASGWLRRLRSHLAPDSPVDWTRDRTLDLSATNDLIRRAVAGDLDAFLLARPGVNEADVVRHYLGRRIAGHHRLSGTLALDAPSIRPDYPTKLVIQTETVAGVSPASAVDLDRFATTYLDSIMAADHIVTMPWTAWMGLLPGLTAVSLSQLIHLSPFAALEAGLVPWTAGLKGRRVLIVHPFVRSIQEQYERRRQITGVSELLPNFDLYLQRPPVTHAKNPDNVTWRTGLERTIEYMDGVAYDVALVGAGAYGLPLAAHARSRGKVGIHMGAALQLIFGISGSRWRRTGEVAQFDDSSWKAPYDDERPSAAELVEGAAYW